MKRCVFFLTIVLLFFSLSGFSAMVGIDRARIAGREFFSRNCRMHHLPAHRNASIISEFTIGEAKSPDYYVFNFSGTGFVIVSADDAVYPVLGYSYESSYSREDLSPEFSFWMEQYVSQIRHVRENHLPADATISRAWAGLLGMESHEKKDGANDPSGINPPDFPDNTPAEVQPLISDIWHQYFPYNALCPVDSGSWGGHVPVGCVATAMSMIMHYWRYPATGRGSHCDNAAPAYGSLCADFGATTYDWNGMKQSLSDTSDPVAVLCYHTGISLDMIYGTNVSWAYFGKVAPALVNYFGYSPSAQYLSRSDYSTSDWVALLKADLDASRPIAYGGDGPSGGHGWVCDGYQSDDYFHMNWGWGGTYNGYFYLDNLNPGSNTFTNNQSATINIQPDATRVTLVFNSFDTEAGNDEVTVYDDVTGNLLGRYSGSYPVLPPPVTSASGQMLVMFTTNLTIRGQGWDASYSSNTGASENDIRNQITLFPNPATDVLHVNIPALSNRYQGHINILDLRSNILLSHSLHDVTADLDVSRLASGMYFLQVTTSEGNWVRRFVVSGRLFGTDL